MPKTPLNHILGHITKHLQDNHPAIIDRLASLAGCQFLICPTDMPHEIRLTIGVDHVTCVIEDEFMAPADVRITGTMMALLDLLNGSVDGDALFFSRSLTVEGDTEALLTLRNAMDSDDIDLTKEILSSFGPLKPPVKSILPFGERLFERASRDMATINQAMTAPLSRRCESLEQDNQALRNNISQLNQKMTKVQNRLQSLGRKINQTSKAPL